MIIIPTLQMRLLRFKGVKPLTYGSSPSGYRTHAPAHCMHCLWEPLLMVSYTGSTLHGMQRTVLSAVLPSLL